MADLVARLKLDSSDYNSNIDSAKDKTKSFQNQADETNKTLNDLGNKGTKSTADLIKEMGKLEGAGRSASNYRRQLAEIQKTITDLTIGYRNMSKEMQQSELGNEVSDKIRELTSRAAEYKDAIMDVQEEIKKMASDTAAWDGLKQGIDTVSSALQGFVAAGVLGEQSTEKLVAVIAKLKATEAATNAVIKIGNALQKNSALMSAISTLQTKALTRAKILETSATKGATVAQKAFNIIAKANPYLLLASAILAVGAALLIFSKNTKTATKAQEDFNKKIKNVGEAAAEPISKFSLLKAQYKSLRTEAEKTEWLKENKTKLDDLGISINDVNDADDVFIKNSDKVIRAMKLRAEAAAMMDTYQEQYAEAYKESLKIQDGRQSSFMSSNRIRKEWRDAGLGSEDYTNTPITMQSTAGAFTSNIYTLTESGRKKMEEYWKKQGENALKAFEEGAEGMFADVQAKLTEATKLENELGHFNKNNNNNNNNNKKLKEEREIVEGTKKALEDELSTLKSSLPYLETGTEEWKKTLTRINEINTSLEKINKNEEAFLNRLKNPIQKLEIPVVPKLEGKIEYKGNGLAIKPKLSPSEMADALKDAVSKAGEISEWVNIGAIKPEQAKTMIDSLNKELEKLGLSVTVKLDLDPAPAVKKMYNFVDTLDRIGSATNAISSLNAVYTSISSLADKLKESTNVWESFFAIFETGVTVLSAVANVIETVATITDILTAAKMANTSATVANTTAATADAAAQGADAAAATTNAVAHGAAAATKSGESVASIPIAGPALAIAAIVAVMAAVVAAIASAKGFANGGIVDSPLKYGDKNVVRVNGGEMILNQKQQANLFKLLDEGREDRNNSIGGNVDFRISGTQLVGVLNNVNKKNSKL